MSWEQYQIALRLMAEEKVGSRIREIEAEEQAKFTASRDAILKG